MNNEQRETKEVKAGKNTLIINTYITGREARDIESSLMDKLEMSQNVEKGTEIKGFSGSLLRDRQDMQVKYIVVSVNGKSENILDTILDLPVKESEEIMEIIRGVAEPKKEAASNKGQ